MPEPEDRSLFEFNRSLGPQSEAMAVEIWQSLFPRIAEAKSKLDGPYVAVVENRSSLRLDDRYLGAWRGNGLYMSAMNAALDNLLAVQTILEPVIARTGELPMVALHPVLRAAIECASQAIYLMAPDERDERLRRAYLLVDDDADLQKQFSVSMGNVDAADNRNQTRDDILELVASRPSLGDPTAFPFARVSYSEMVKKADEVLAADPAMTIDHRLSLLGWWQMLSGLSHGKFWAFIVAMERSGAVVDQEEEIANVRMTTPAGAVAVALMRAVELLECALRLWGKRTKDWTNRPEDASEPAAVSYTELRCQREA